MGTNRDDDATAKRPSTDDFGGFTADELLELRVADRLVMADLKSNIEAARLDALTARERLLERDRRIERLTADLERHGRSQSPDRTGKRRGSGDSVDDVEALRADLAQLRAERDNLRDRLQRQYDLRWTRIGAVLRRLIREPRHLVRIPFALVREARRPIDRASKGSATTKSTVEAKLSIAERAASFLAAGELEQAIELLDAGLRKYPTRTDLLEQKRKTLIAKGELTASLSVSRRRHSIDRSDAAFERCEQISGRLRELDPRWHPHLGPPKHFEPSATGRVLHLLKESLPYHERGYTMRSHYAIRSQQAAGFQPAVSTSLGFPRLDGFEPDGALEVIDGIPHYRHDLGPSFPYRDIPFDEGLAIQTWLAERVVREFRPTMVHANSGYRGYETAVIALALRDRFGIPVVYDVRSFLESTWTGDVSRSEDGEHYQLRLAREIQCMNSADLVFTIADTMRDEIVNRGVDPEKIVVIPNAVDTDHFVPLTRDDDLARSLGLRDKTVLGYVSNLSQREGVDVLIKAARHLSIDRSDLACLVVGDGPELEGLRRLRSELGLEDVVVLTGSVPHSEVMRYYSLIDVFVVPRRDDRAARLVTPLKPFEAMAMAIPLVVSDLPALTEIADPGTRGLKFDVEEPGSLAAVVAPLLDHPELRRRFGSAGRAWVERERTWASNGDRYVEAYARLGVRPAGARND